MLQTSVECGQSRQFGLLHTKVLTASDSLMFYQWQQHNAEDGDSHQSYTLDMNSQLSSDLPYSSIVLRSGTSLMSLILGASEEIFYFKIEVTIIV